MLYVLILYIGGGEQQFKIDFERQIFEELFMEILFLLSEFFLEICERKSPKRYFFMFLL